MATESTNTILEGVEVRRDAAPPPRQVRPQTVSKIKIALIKLEEKGDEKARTFARRMEQRYPGLLA